ncbi:N-acylglucosamine 2-epimerase [Georgenia sp. 311]|uniref:AGE family epimerase/isomerase n=1 Tax=Georgenia sp. 311 TaxID=2585134 RepID=UPI00111279B9|nr:AGE family epimerase/isomerase [Georgenia sp. 311]TNC18067.1 N-acylglucosamine 2-epimerase [Georgenia sp. 311]
METVSWRRHLEQDVLPWWQGRALDDEVGGVFTCFDNDGVLLSQEKYTWSQGRWAWLCAELAEEARAGRLDVDAEAWAARATGTARFLAAHVPVGEGRTAFRTDRHGRRLTGPDGEVAASVFADLFAALGLGAAARVDPSAPPEWVRLATTILTTAETAILDRTALTAPYPVPPGFRDLAGPMNLLHTAAELLRARDAGAAAAPADWERVTAVRDRALASLHEEFLDRATWFEFRPERAGLDEAMLARHRTPGHLLEALWMLVHAEQQAGLVPDTARYLALARTALAIGWDAEEGGVLRYTDRDGGPPRGDLLGPEPTPYEALVAGTWDTKLWWVHAEALYATALLASLTGDTDMAAWAERVAGYTMDTFPDAVNGEWLQIRERSGAPLNAVVALPVKDPFHVIRALIFLNRTTPQGAS